MRKKRKAQGIRPSRPVSLIDPHPTTVGDPTAYLRSMYHAPEPPGDHQQPRHRPQRGRDHPPHSRAPVPRGARRGLPRRLEAWGQVHEAGPGRLHGVLRVGCHGERGRPASGTLAVQ